MSTADFKKAALLCLVLSACFIVSLELYWRQKGFKPIFNDDAALWAETRKQAYLPADEATVFIGSSRIKFDLDIRTWENITGEQAIQLAMVGTSPRQLLQDLARDERFRGKLVIDVTEGLFFSLAPQVGESAKEGLDYYKNYSPSQRASNLLNYELESRFVFLEESKFALNELLREIPLKDRPGVISLPVFPKEFGWTTRERQTYMSDAFLSDTTLQKRQTEIWTFFGRMMSGVRPISGDTLTGLLAEYKTNIDRIRSRGGQVIFVRTPSSGPLLEGERKSFPREKYWDRLLAFTQTPGIHFLDDPATDHYVCPEWSHLGGKDVADYTIHLIRLLEQKGWKFPRRKQPPVVHSN